MARKDRRFTAKDVARFYCRNIQEEARQEVLELLLCDWYVDEPGEGGELDFLDDFAIWMLLFIADKLETINAPGFGIIARLLRLISEAAQESREWTEEEIIDFLGFGDILQ